MKRLLLIATALLCWSGGAFGQVLSEFTKGYRGAWCSASREGDDENIYRRCRGEEGGLFIAARRFTEGEEDKGLEDCVPVHAIRTNYGDLIVRPYASRRTVVVIFSINAGSFSRVVAACRLLVWEGWLRLQCRR